MRYEQIHWFKDVIRDKAVSKFLLCHLGNMAYILLLVTSQLHNSCFITNISSAFQVGISKRTGQWKASSHIKKFPRRLFQQCPLLFFKRLYHIRHSLFLPFERTTVIVIKQDVLMVAICYVGKPFF